MLRSNPDGRVRMIVAEMKSDSGTVTAAQQRWIDDLRANGGQA